jgi:hypothetical protein
MGHAFALSRNGCRFPSDPQILTRMEAESSLIVSFSAIIACLHIAMLSKPPGP